MKTFSLEPHVAGQVRLGSTKDDNVILVGRVAERANSEQLLFDASDNFVVLEVGKRGSGKSYGMGSMLEGFATNGNSVIARHKEKRGVLLLDPLDIHWTAVEPLRPGGPPGMERQYGVLSAWGGLQVEPIAVRAFIPAGFEWDIDHPAFQSYQLPVSDLDAADWAHLLDCDLINDTRGRLINEVYIKATDTGFIRGGFAVRPRQDYSVQDLIDCAEQDDDITDFYHAETIRSVVQPLRAFARMPLFQSRGGTALTTLIDAGVLSIMCMGRLPADIRSVLTTVMIRRLRRDRMYASQIRRRLALQEVSAAERTKLETELDRHIPRTVLAIDEAQILMPANNASATRKEIDAYVLEGRNYGLSLWMATQRPKGAISNAATSQIDTFIVHRLSVKEDIDAVCGLLQNAQPETIRLQGRSLDLGGLIRSLDVGQAIFSSATSSASRLIVGSIRPRMVAHGGEAF
jgi:uncharacterized protein